MKRIILLSAISFLLLNSTPVWAGAPVWNSDQTICAYVDFVLPQDHTLAAFTGGAKTIFFYKPETDERYRGTYYRFGSRLDEYSSANSLEIVEWVDSETICVKASFNGDWNWIGGTETYLFSVDGRTEFKGFEDLPPADEITINYGYLAEDYSYVWDFMDTSLEIEEFMTALCSGDGSISESRLPEGIMDDPLISEYDSFEDYLGCKDVIMYVMPNDEGLYDVSSVWHGYQFGYVDSGTLAMLNYAAPADL